uniref:Leishmanolysin-like peptidase n=1 Tax=Parastrongyloides trichosuri TaxID=131310 RepID=A0A0N5A394_PARTI
MLSLNLFYTTMMLKYFILAAFIATGSVFGVSDGDKEKAYRKYIGERELPVPFKTKVSEPLKTGHTIHVIGKISEKPKRIDFNFHKGAGDDADMPLHLSIRFDEGIFHSKIVYNIYENGNWSETEQRISNPFKANSDFDLRVRITDGLFKVFANRKEIGTFKQRTSIDGIDHVSITGDIKSLSLFKYGGAIFETPYTALANLTPGKRLDIAAVSKGKRVDIDLNRKNGDTALQLSIRYGEKAIVRNSKTGDVWGTEERTGKFNLEKGEVFDVTIINESWSFQIFINGQRYAAYSHRGDINDVRNVEITGDVELLTVTVNDKALQSAIIWIQDLLYVRNMHKGYIVTENDYNRCAEIKLFTKSDKVIATIYSSRNNKIFKTPISLNNSFDLIQLKANFAIVLDVNKGTCSRTSLELAYANLCNSENLHKYQRPIIARVVICQNSPSWKDIAVPEDVMKHEIMHALGFGMYHERKRTRSKGDKINWKISNDPKKTFKFQRHFMDFDEKAVAYAQKHFECPLLKHIEADTEKKFHLNEYIFGNELMTPISSKTKNIFTEISASILESTFLGNQSWYKFDMAKIKKETKNYWYGRGWGCEFLEKSCIEYIEKNPKKAFPFCSLNDYLISYWRGSHFSVCYQTTKRRKNRILAKCNIQQYVDEPGIKMNMNRSSITDYYPILLQYGVKSNLFGSSKLFRYCPMIKEIANNEPFLARIDNEGTRIVEC